MYAHNTHTYTHCINTHKYLAGSNLINIYSLSLMVLVRGTMYYAKILQVFPFNLFPHLAVLMLITPI